MKDFNFSVKNFEGWFFCKENGLYTLTSSCNEFNYKFESGVYAMTGEFTEGGVAFTYALTNEFSKKQLISEETEFFSNEEKITLQELSHYVQYLGFSHSRKITDRLYHNTVQQQVERGIKKHHLNLTAEEVRQMFHIADCRFERNIRYVGFEHQKCNAAIGLVNGKKIFCFPYMPRNIIDPILPFVKNICEVLKEQGCIVLLPVHDCSVIEGIYDTEINIMERFYQEHPE